MTDFSKILRKLFAREVVAPQAPNLDLSKVPPVSKEAHDRAIKKLDRLPSHWHPNAHVTYTTEGTRANAVTRAVTIAPRVVADEKSNPRDRDQFMARLTSKKAS